MGINIFIASFIVIILIISNLSVVDDSMFESESKKPLLVFQDAVMYKIDKNNTKDIVYASSFFKYKDKDELYDMNTTYRNEYNQINRLSAKKVFQTNNIYKFYDDVMINIHNKKNKIKLWSNYVKFDKNKKILQNDRKFILHYNDNTMVGKNIYYDMQNNILKSKKTNFNLKIQR